MIRPPLGSAVSWSADWGLFGGLLGPLFTVLPYRLGEVVLGIGWDGFAHRLFLWTAVAGASLGLGGGAIGHRVASRLFAVHPALALLPGPVIGAIGGAALAGVVYAVEPATFGARAVSYPEIARIAVPSSALAVGAGFVVYVVMRAAHRSGWGALAVTVLVGLVAVPLAFALSEM
ncbi:MAG: hypothetical protein ABMB14_20620 [Myxococcota bacterium]